jgi:multidrug resistance efflux pump
MVGVGGRLGGLTRQAARAQPPAAKGLAAPTGKATRKEKNGGPEIIKSRVPDQANVMRLAPDGSRVEKGQVICELDSAALKDRLVNQQITSTTALTSYENSRLTREVAEIAVVEYAEGVFPNELLEVTGDIKIAEAELALAEGELKNTLDLAKRSLVGDLDVSRGKLAVVRAKFALEKAQSRRKLLLDYTRGKTLKTLKSAVANAHSEEMGQKAIWEMQLAKAKELERHIANCTIVAPRDGILQRKPLMGEGATVRDGQVMFEIVPDVEKQ